MEFDTYKYLKKYFRDRFPMYYELMREDELVEFIKNIMSDPIFKAFKKEQELLSNGIANDVIDILFEQKIESLMPETTKSFKEFLDHVKNVIRKNREEFKLKEKTLDIISREIVINIIKDNYSLEYTSFVSGEYDENFLMAFDMFAKKLYHKGYKHIMTVVKDSKLKVGYDKESRAYLYDMVMDHYTLDDVINGLSDVDIISKFNSCCDELVREIKAHISNVLNNMELPLGIDQKKVTKDFLQMATTARSISAKQLIDGKLDQFIDDYAKKSRKSLSSANSIDYIYRLVSSREFFGSEEDLMNIVYKIDSKLRNQHGAHSYDIVNHKYDTMIGNMFDVEVMINSSIKNDTAPDKVEHETRRRKLPNNILLLWIAAILSVLLTVGSIGYVAVDAIQDGIDSIKTTVAINQLEDRDLADSSLVYTVHSDQFDEVVDGVVKFYSACKENGVTDTKYTSLGLYLARNQVRGNNVLAVMDQLLEDVQRKVFRDENLSGYGSELSGCSCFVEFAYKRLLAMGCEKVESDKYADAVKAYKEAAIDASLEDDKTPCDMLKPGDLKTVEKIMDLYAEYTDEYLIEFADLSSDWNLSALGYSLGNNGKSGGGRI